MLSTNPIYRVGIVGYGYMGEIRRRNIANNPELRLVAICDPNREEEIKALGVTYHNQWEDVIYADLDIIFVCTPNNLIPEIAIAALNNGKNVFCEKPPGRNLNDIQRIRAAEIANNKQKLIFGFNHRHHPGITDAKAIMDSGALGEILTLRGVYGKSGGYEYQKSWRNNPSIGGGGILLDQGLHMIDLFHLFVGEFTDVIGMRGVIHYDIPVEDNAFVILRTQKGQIAQLHSTATSWKHIFRIEIGCSAGYVVISGLLSKTGSYGRETLVVGRRPARGEKVAIGNPREETTYYDDDPSWDIEVGHFVECIQQNQSIKKGSSMDALKAMEVVDRIYREPIFQFKSKEQ